VNIVAIIYNACPAFAYLHIFLLKICVVQTKLSASTVTFLNCC